MQKCHLLGPEIQGLCPDHTARDPLCTRAALTGRHRGLAPVTGERLASAQSSLTIGFSGTHVHPACSVPGRHAVKIPDLPSPPHRPPRQAPSSPAPVLGEGPVFAAPARSLSQDPLPCWSCPSKALSWQSRSPFPRALLVPSVLGGLARRPGGREQSRAPHMAAVGQESLTQPCPSRPSGRSVRHSRPHLLTHLGLYRSLPPSRPRPRDTSLSNWTDS